MISRNLVCAHMCFNLARGSRLALLSGPTRSLPSVCSLFYPAHQSFTRRLQPQQATCWSWCDEGMPLPSVTSPPAVWVFLLKHLLLRTRGQCTATLGPVPKPGRLLASLTKLVLGWVPMLRLIIRLFMSSCIHVPCVRIHCWFEMFYVPERRRLQACQCPLT